MTSISTAPVALKDRFYVYRNVSTHFRRNAAEFDQAYWDLVNAAKKRKAEAAAALVVSP
jgi:hypothetical protein